MKTLMQISLLSTAAILTACGGGGTDSTDPGDQIGSAPPAVEGRAAKGLLSGATVEVYAVDDGGNDGAGCRIRVDVSHAGQPWRH